MTTRNKKKKLDHVKSFTALSILFLLSSAVIYAFPSIIAPTEITTGKINVSLDTYTVVDGILEEKIYDGQLILPGTDVSLIHRITNEGNDCYVRAKILFSGTGEDIENGIYGMPDGWVKSSDGYYYYKNVLNSGEQLVFFEGFKVPGNFPQTDSGKTISLKVCLDAIQSQNFNPDYTASSPWGAVEIQTCSKTGSYVVSEAFQVEEQTIRVTYQGDADSLVTNQEDFFVNFPVLMPGDEYSDSAVIENDSNKAMKLYFRSEAMEDDPLLENINLSISFTVDGKTKVVYEGAMNESEISSLEYLGTIPANGKGDLDFTINVAADLDNEYAVLSSYVTWYLSTEPLTEPLQPQTGDNTNAAVWLAVAGVSTFAIAVLLRKREKEGDQE